jgi:hypothetical protein
MVRMNWSAGTVWYSYIPATIWNRQNSPRNPLHIINFTKRPYVNRKIIHPLEVGNGSLPHRGSKRYRDKGKPVARNNESKWKAKGIKVSSLNGLLSKGK